MKAKEFKKIVCIGDIHGKDIWKKIVDKEKDAGLIIFMGDYWDSFTISTKDQIKNYKEILEYKKNNLDKVILLIGNHDYHYFRFSGEQCSGYQKDGGFIDLMNQESSGYLQMCYDHGGYLFTHAGVTKTWCKNNKIDMDNISKSINNLFKENTLSTQKAFKFTPDSKHDNYGNSITQPPIWVRPESLESDSIEGFVQVVGHTHQKCINIKEKFIYTDTFDNCGEYLIIDNGITMIGEVKK